MAEQPFGCIHCVPELFDSNHLLLRLHSVTLKSFEWNVCIFDRKPSKCWSRCARLELCARTFKLKVSRRTLMKLIIKFKWITPTKHLILRNFFFLPRRFLWGTYSGLQVNVQELWIISHELFPMNHRRNCKSHRPILVARFSSLVNALCDLKRFSLLGHLFLILSPVRNFLGEPSASVRGSAVNYC